MAPTFWRAQAVITKSGRMVLGFGGSVVLACGITGLVGFALKAVWSSSYWWFAPLMFASLLEGSLLRYCIWPAVWCGPDLFNERTQRQFQEAFGRRGGRDKSV